MGRVLVLAMPLAMLAFACKEDGTSGSSGTGDSGNSGADDGSDDGGSDDGGGSGDDGGSGTGDCASQPDFASCEPEGGGDGICLGGVCVGLSPCGGDGCDGPGFRLADTNLRLCFGPSPDGQDGTIPCPGTPGDPSCATTDYCGEDAQYGWDTENEASARFTVTGAGSGEPIVTDEVTGLVWQGCSAGQTGDGCEGEATLQTWFDAVDFCDGLSWGGFDDWTLPKSHELHSITDFSTTSPAIDLGAFPNTPSRFAEDYDQWWIECVWTSSDYARDPDVAWVLMSNSGDISEGSGTEFHLNDKAAEGWEGCYARCVREPAAPQYERFVRLEPVDGEPIVADTVTHLLWQGCSSGQTGSDCTPQASMLDWQESLAHCEGLSWGGYDDWRLPDVKELRSIVDESRDSPAIDVGAFPNTPCYGPIIDDNAGQYWSSTGRSYNSFALYVEFGTGFSHFYEQPELRHVRCVR